MTIEAAIGAIQAIVGAVSGIKGAPDYPPESLGVYPMAVCYPGDGDVEIKVAGEMQGLHNIVLEVHAARKNLKTDVDALIGFGDTIPAALLADTTLDGAVDTFGGMSYRFGGMSYNGMDTIGWRFTLRNVKIRSNV